MTLPRSLVALALISACSGAPKPAAPESRPAPSPVAAEPPARPAPPPPTAARDAARAEVQRLTALADQDPLLAPWPGPHGGVPPWDKIKIDAFPKAFEVGIALTLAEVDAIAENPEPPTFDNTFAALEDIGRYAGRAETLFGVMTGNQSTPEVQAIDKAWSPRMAAARDKITFNDKLFARVTEIWNARAELDPEKRRLVELRYERLVKAGAKLSAAEKAKVGAINQELAGLFTEFSKKVLADENSWIALGAKDLDGLSPSLKASYAAAAERKLDGKWAVVNTRSSVDPFLASSTRRDLREQVWKAFKHRGDNGGDNDTHQTFAKIVKLRADRARLLGYPTHAHWRMSETMARDPAKASELMMKVWKPAVARVREEVADMEKIARRDGMKGAFEPWDYLYYAEKVRKAKYNVDESELKPYFELNSMIAASHWMAEKLYNLTLTEITGSVPVFEPSVRVWEVKDKTSGAHVGLFYGDYFARKGKRSGAWTEGYRRHESFTGKVQTTITSNNNNFVKAAPGEPVLISLDDARTLFHEFGHSLHALLSEVRYPGLGITPRDFVEYPSQVHEFWVLTRPVLDRFAKHYKTGKPMPQALVDKVTRSARFNQGYTTVEYLSSAIVDMELHTIPDGAINPETFERDTLERIGAPHEVAMRHRLPQFNHLFASDSYSAGYYSYLWSEVMDADTREAFTEAGDVFAPAVAQKLRTFILAPGNSTDRAEAYRQFRGRDPDVTALLKKRGFPTGK